LSGILQQKMDAWLAIGGVLQGYELDIRALMIRRRQKNQCMVLRVLTLTFIRIRWSRTCVCVGSGACCSSGVVVLRPVTHTRLGHSCSWTVGLVVISRQRTVYREWLLFDLHYEHTRSHYLVMSGSQHQYDIRLVRCQKRPQENHVFCHRPSLSPFSPLYTAHTPINLLSSRLVFFISYAGCS